MLCNWTCQANEFDDSGEEDPGGQVTNSYHLLLPRHSN
jgi:hypothetical protein